MVSLQKELEQIIKQGGRKSLLLHSCCAPCSSYVLEYLNQYFDITLFFYNPNITPQNEYNLRFNELNSLILQMPELAGIEIIDGDYNPDVFLSAVKGLESEPEGGKRCEICFNLRLSATANRAKELNLDFFTTTLSISPHKSSNLLDYIALNVSQQHGVARLPSNFKKKGGYLRSIELSKQYDLYRQEWCGCAFSKLETERRTNE